MDERYEPKTIDVVRDEGVTIAFHDGYVDGLRLVALVHLPSLPGQSPRCAAATERGTTIRQASRTISRISSSSRASRRATTQL